MSRQGDDPNPTQAGAGDPPAGNGGGGSGDPTPTHSNTPPAAGGDGGPAGGDDPEAIRRSLEAARKGEKDAQAREREARRALEAAQAELQKHQDSQKSELEQAIEARTKAEKDMETERQRARRATVRFAVMEAARAEGFANPEDPMYFLSLDAIEFDDDGQPKGVSDLVKDLAKQRKYLLASQQSAAQPPNPSPNPTRDGKGATPEELKQRREAAATQTRSYF